jgi:hypothetical protein
MTITSIAPERGQASILISLTDGSITVDHGTDEILLGEKRVARSGDWDKLIDFLKRDLGIKWKVRDEL